MMTKNTVDVRGKIPPIQPAVTDQAKSYLDAHILYLQPICNLFAHVLSSPATLPNGH